MERKDRHPSSLALGVVVLHLFYGRLGKTGMALGSGGGGDGVVKAVNGHMQRIVAVSLCKSALAAVKMTPK